MATTPPPAPIAGSHRSSRGVVVPRNILLPRQPRAPAASRPLYPCPIPCDTVRSEVASMSRARGHRNSGAARSPCLRHQGLGRRSLSEATAADIRAHPEFTLAAEQHVVANYPRGHHTVWPRRPRTDCSNRRIGAPVLSVAMRESPQVATKKSRWWPSKSPQPLFVVSTRSMSPRRWRCRQLPHRPGSFIEAEARDVLEIMDELLHQLFVLWLGRRGWQPRDNSVDNFRS
jgi:hypothetical protein